MTFPKRPPAPPSPRHEPEDGEVNAVEQDENSELTRAQKEAEARAQHHRPTPGNTRMSC